MPNYQKRIVYLSEEQLSQLYANGSITVNGTTITYSDNDMYVTPQDTPYVKPANGIPASDLSSGVIPDVSGFYTKPVGGIPASDLASGVIPDASGFYTKPVTGIPASDLASGVIPTVPVTDVQINGTSILNDGVANVPIAGPNTAGAIMVRQSTDGLFIGENTHQLGISSAPTASVKGGTNNYRPIVPYNQHISAFYALAKLAGADLASSDTPVGTYTDAALQAIQKLFGLSGLLGPYEDDITADQAYAIGQTFVMNGKRYKATAAISQGGVITPGTNCELAPIDGHYVRDTDIATADKAGVAKVNGTEGISVVNNAIRVVRASSTRVKAGTNGFEPIVPVTQHEAAFYGLAKAAGDTTQASSDNAVGTYTDNAKTAILAMLGISLSNANSAQEVIAAYANSAIRTDASGVSF